MSRVAHATIDLKALKHNFQVVKQHATQSRVMVVIKANAYSHGLLTVADTLTEADAYAVAHLEAALKLRSQGFSQRIVLLQGFIDVFELDALITHEIEPVIHHQHQLALLKQARFDGKFPVWLKIDTGMHRLGFLPEEIPEVWNELNAIPALAGNINLMSHLACADERENDATVQQLTEFLACTNPYKAEKSLANSGGILGWPSTHLDWVRPGIMLYGVSPFAESSADQLNLKPVMTLHSTVIATKFIRKGDAVGYGATWRAPSDTNIGVIGIGYGDGYPRHVDKSATVLIAEKRFPVVGRVSMDMITVDLGQQTSIGVGSPVILWGRGLPVEEIAKSAGTIAYELLCQITPRVNFSVKEHG